MSRRSLHLILSLAALALAPALALAADDSHAAAKPQAIQGVKEGLFSAITSLVVFALVFAFLAAKVWPGIVRKLDQRADKIKAEIEAAELARQQAKDALEQYERSLLEARAEAQKMIEAAKVQQQQLAAELRAKNEAEIAAMKDRARRDIAAARREAISDVYAQSAALAAQIAAKILRREVNSADQQRLIEESLSELAASNS